VAPTAAKQRLLVFYNAGGPDFRLSSSRLVYGANGQNSPLIDGLQPGVHYEFRLVVEDLYRYTTTGGFLWDVGRFEATPASP
jgi:hypothetical protein